MKKQIDWNLLSHNHIDRRLAWTTQTSKHNNVWMKSITFNLQVAQPLGAYVCVHVRVGVCANAAKVVSN